MRIHTERTTEYLQMLAAAISKDAKSLSAWHCLLIHPDTTDYISLRLIEKVRETFKETDCDIMICEDGDVLLISDEMNTLELQNIADLITMNLQQPAEISAYELSKHFRSFRTLLLSKTEGFEPLYTLEKPHNFGEIASLAEIFSEAKKRRKGRQPQHIMVVEDDPLTRRIINSAFKENYALITAADAHEAVANYLLHAPDIVFLDIGLPDTSGFDVLQQIMQCDPEAYVVMFSSNSYLDNVARSLSSGASGFIAKPFKKDSLSEYIKNSASHHQKSC